MSKNKISYRKYKFITIICLFVIAVYCYWVLTWKSGNSESHKMNEAFLLKTVTWQFNNETKLEKDPNYITDDDLAKIKYYHLSNKELSDINLLGKLKNLETLSLQRINFPKKDIPKWMTILAKIHLVDLSKVCLIDYSPIEKLINLRKISLYGSKIRDIKLLSNLKNLQELDLSVTPISDLEPLKSVTSLQSLSIGNMQVTDFNFLSDMTNLKELWLDNDRIYNLTPIKDLKNLQKLSLSGTKISDLKLLEGLTNLNTLWLGRSQVKSVKSLQELKNLKILSLRETQVSDISPLRKLIKLEQLDITKCNNITEEQVEDLQKALPNLEIKK